MDYNKMIILELGINHENNVRNTVKNMLTWQVFYLLSDLRLIY